MSDASNETRCPVLHTSAGSRPNSQWWPEQIDLDRLHRNSAKANPMGEGFDYASEFTSLDLDEVIRDIVDVMTDSQEWWPADFGHYGPLFIRMAWHSAGTYRVADGRGGAGRGYQRFAPLNSWPDNANLDKARRLLWPVKAKYGRKLSWGDLIILAGNCALESMGFKTFGFGGGRADVWEPDDDTYWGPEQTWLGDERYSGERQLENPLGAVQMGLIYVNPEGPNGTPDPLAAAVDIRETFARMAMDDTETVALIAGGHTFGKFHGAVPADYIGREPEGAPLEQQGLGWRNSYGTGSGADTYTSGLEGTWTVNPIRWDNGFFDNLFRYEWELTTSPAGAKQWTPKDPGAQGTVPDAHDPSKRHAPTMLTTDLAMKVDPSYRVISERFHAHPDEFAEAFAKAWFKLTHRDMGPRSRYLGPLVPSEPQIWQDPLPEVDHDLVSNVDVETLGTQILASGLAPDALIAVAWASASTFRATDMRGGANGARVRLEPQKNWEVNNPSQLADTLASLESIQMKFNESRSDGTRVSLADLIVLGGCLAIRQAAAAAGQQINVPFTPGRTDAVAEMTDVDSFALLEPRADGFRNYLRAAEKLPPEHLLVERANLLGLSAPEMTVLVGGMRCLGVTFEGTRHGVLTDRPGVLSNDFFVNLLDMGTEWSVSPDEEHVFVGRKRATGDQRWTATAVDLVFGSNSQLRAISEVYASDDGAAKLVSDFVSTWDKVMMADRL